MPDQRFGLRQDWAGGLSAEHPAAPALHADGGGGCADEGEGFKVLGWVSPSFLLNPLEVLHRAHQDVRNLVGLFNQAESLMNLIVHRRPTIYLHS